MDIGEPFFYPTSTPCPPGYRIVMDGLEFYIQYWRMERKTPWWRRARMVWEYMVDADNLQRVARYETTRAAVRAVEAFVKDEQRSD